MGNDMHKILVTGSNGLVGSAIKKLENDYPAYSFYWATREDADLTNPNEVKYLYKKVQPDAVIHTAAKVGGLGANLVKPAEFFYQNVMMNSNVIHYGYEFGVKKLINFSSVCTFPHDLETITEEDQQKGQPYDGNYAYGWAKRLGDIQIRAYNEQYKTKYTTLILTNVYGSNDNWNLSDGHVIPALIHKCYLAKQQGKPISIWGDGSAKREFVYSDDVARLTMGILESYRHADKILISGGELLSIKHVAMCILEAMDYEGMIEWDTTKSNGRNGAHCDMSLLKQILSSFQFTDFKQGIKETVDWFNDNYPNVRK